MIRWLASLLLVLISASGFAQDRLEGFIWPTDSSPYLTSTFGETRSAHFHTGIDIKTWGQEGYRVFASKAGHISRIHVSPTGYGKALYLTHDDGTTTVYAHLQRFAPRLEQWIDSVRWARQTPEISIDVRDTGMKVDQREVIGYTGSTGVGPPHLHFEIRDINEVALNPLRSNLSVTDTRPPIFTSLLIEPLTPNAYIEGSLYPSLLYPGQKEGDTTSFGMRSVTDKVGLSVSVYDVADKVNNKYEVYELLLLSNQDTLHHLVHDEIEFEDGKFMFQERIPARGARKRSYQKLYTEAASSPFSITSNRDGLLPDSTQTYTFIARDFYGNTSTATVTLTRGLVMQSESLTTATRIPDETWFWRKNWATADGLSSVRFNESFGMTVDAQHQFVWDSVRSALYSEIIPDQRSEIVYPNQDMHLTFFEDTFLDTTTLAIVQHDATSNTGFSIFPGSQTPLRDYAVSLFVRDSLLDSGGYHLYHVDEQRDKLSFVPSFFTGRMLTAYPSQLGVFKILQDTVPPVILDSSLKQSRTGTWNLAVKLEDALSGVDFKSGILQVNGQQGLTEYDPETDELIFFRPGFTPQKENEVVIMISDFAGNQTTTSLIISK
ncbi:MAG: M23 family metallopeptidase [Bacteroidota bacterium]